MKGSITEDAITVALPSTLLPTKAEADCMAACDEAYERNEAAFEKFRNKFESLDLYKLATLSS